MHTKLRTFEELQDSLNGIDRQCELLLNDLRYLTTKHALGFSDKLSTTRLGSADVATSCDKLQRHLARVFSLATT